MNSRKLFVVFALVVLFVSIQLLAQESAAPQVPAPAGAAGTENNPVKVNVSVDLVNIAASVRDTTGKYLDGLTQQDFTVLENGVEQKLSFFNHDTQANLSVGVLVDTSGSMRHKLQQALQTVREVSLALSPQDEMFLITFNDDVDIRQRFTKNPAEVSRALQGVRSGGETSVYDALQIGIQEMRNAKNGKRILLLVSDGYDTRSKINMNAALEELKRSQLQLYAIGVEQWKGRIPSRAVLHFLRPDVVVDVDLSEAALMRARQMTEQFFLAQSTVEFPLRVEQHCFRCPHYRGLCPADVKTPASPEAAEMKQASLW